MWNFAYLYVNGDDCTYIGKYQLTQEHNSGTIIIVVIFYNFYKEDHS